MKTPKYPGALVGGVSALVCEAYFAAKGNFVPAAVLATALGFAGLRTHDSVKSFGAGSLMVGASSLGILAVAAVDFDEVRSKDIPPAEQTETTSPYLGDNAERSVTVGALLDQMLADVVVVFPEGTPCSEVGTYTVAPNDGPRAIAEGLGATLTDSVRLYSAHPNNMPWPNDTAVGVREIGGDGLVEALVCTE